MPAVVVAPTTPSGPVTVALLKVARPLVVNVSVPRPFVLVMPAVVVAPATFSVPPTFVAPPSLAKDVAPVEFSVLKSPVGLSANASKLTVDSKTPSTAATDHAFTPLPFTRWSDVPLDFPLPFETSEAAT